VKPRALKTVESSEDAVYLRFSKLTIARSVSYANGEINVDIDDHGEVIGIEMLSLDPQEMQALAEIATKYSLNFDAWAHAGRVA